MTERQSAGGFVFALALTIVTAALLLQMLDLGQIARKVPLTTGLLTLILLLVQLTVEARKWMGSRSCEEPIDARFGRAAIQRVAAHLLGLLIAVFLLGLVTGIPLYTLAAHARAGSATVGLAIGGLLGAGCLAADRVLGGLFPGFLWSWIGWEALG